MIIQHLLFINNLLCWWLYNNITVHITPVHQEEEMSDHQKKVISNMSLPKVTEGLAEAQMSVQLNPVEPLSLHDGECLGYPTASNPRGHYVNAQHGSITFDSACVEPIDITKAPVWRVLTTTKIKALTETK